MLVLGSPSPGHTPACRAVASPRRCDTHTAASFPPLAVGSKPVAVTEPGQHGKTGDFDPMLCVTRSADSHSRRPDTQLRRGVKLQSTDGAANGAAGQLSESLSGGTRVKMPYLPAQSTLQKLLKRFAHSPRIAEFSPQRTHEHQHAGQHSKHTSAHTQGRGCPAPQRGAYLFSGLCKGPAYPQHQAPLIIDSLTHTSPHSSQPFLDPCDQ